MKPFATAWTMVMIDLRSRLSDHKIISERRQPGVIAFPLRVAIEEFSAWRQNLDDYGWVQNYLLMFVLEDEFSTNHNQIGIREHSLEIRPLPGRWAAEDFGIFRKCSAGRSQKWRVHNRSRVSANRAVFGTISRHGPNLPVAELVPLFRLALQFKILFDGIENS